jgi:hypothetical protein
MDTTACSGRATSTAADGYTRTYLVSMNRSLDGWTRWILDVYAPRVSARYVCARHATRADARHL